MKNRVQKIQFISPPKGLEGGQVKAPFYSNPPMAFLWLAGYLESKGVDCNIVDAYTTVRNISEILNEIEEYRPDVIGLSVFTIAAYDNLYLAEKIRERFPEIIIVFGGYHVNHYYDDILKNEAVDFCILGEGEVSLWELVECLNHGGDLSKVQGIVWKEDGQIKETVVRSFRQRLDNMPVLPYEKVMINNYKPWCFKRRKNNAFMTVVTSKGCPMQCIFCDIGKTEGKRFRCMSALRVLEEIEHLYYNLGINQIEFLDALFTTKSNRIREICRMIIERKIDIEWACSSSILHSNDIEMLELMKMSGCKAIFYGVESGNAQMLKEIKKVTIDTVKRVVSLTKSVGIQAHTSFILGLPGETKDRMQETVEFAKELAPSSVSFSVAIPYKGTKLFEIYKEKIFVTDYRKFEGSAVFRVPEYTPQYLESMVVEAHREFYLRPRYILSRIRDIRGWRDFWAHMEVAINLLRGNLSYKID